MANLPDASSLVGPAEFLRYSRDELLDMSGLRIDEKQLSDIQFESWSAGQSEARLIEVTDKHGMSKGAHNVGFAIDLEGMPLALGMRNR
jgi:hypothetical protein